MSTALEQAVRKKKKSIMILNIRFCTVHHSYIMVKAMTHITEICFAEGNRLLKPAGCSVFPQDMLQHNLPALFSLLFSLTWRAANGRTVLNPCVQKQQTSKSPQNVGISV